MFFLVLFVYFVFESIPNLLAARAFEKHGVIIEAEVDAGADTAFRIVREAASPGKTEDERYLFVRYDVDGREFNEVGVVPRAVYENAVRSGTHPVRYMADDPSNVEFTIGETWDTGAKARLVAPLSGLTWLATLWLTAGTAFAAMRARRYGPRERARVRAIVPWRYRWITLFMLEFCCADGRIHRSMASKSSLRYAAYPPGTEVDVFRGAKGRLWWVGDLGPREA